MTNQYGIHAVGYRRVTKSTTECSDIEREGAKHERLIMYGLQTGTRLHEAGIPSNR